jgi:RimJ/RimL family protein N-acetyltransferase
MVLGGQPPGRVGRRRFFIEKGPVTGPFFVVRNTGEVELPRPEPPLEDDVIRLRPWTLDDVPAVARACQDPEIPRWTLVPSPYTEADARAWLGSHADSWEDQAPLAITSRDSGEVLGSITLWVVKPHVCEVGYWCAREARGRGYVPRAVRLLALWAFDKLDAARVQLGTLPGNRSSERVAEKLGFTREGVLRAYVDQRGERSDELMWSLLPGELV